LRSRIKIFTRSRSRIKMMRHRNTGSFRCFLLVLVIVGFSDLRGFRVILVLLFKKKLCTWSFDLSGFW
jgi:hypothetical protein